MDKIDNRENKNSTVSIVIPIVPATNIGITGRGIYPLKLTSDSDTIDKLHNIAEDIFINDKNNPVLLSLYNTECGDIIDVPLYMNVFPKEFGICLLTLSEHLQEYLYDMSEYVPEHKLYDVKITSHTETQSIVKSSAEFISKYLLKLHKEGIPPINMMNFGVVEIDGVSLWIMSMRSKGSNKEVVSSSGAAAPLNPELTDNDIIELSKKAIQLAMDKKLVMRIPYDKDIRAVDTRYHCGTDNVHDLVTGMLTNIEDINIAIDKIGGRFIPKQYFN